jgi:hypothetical protein
LSLLLLLLLLLWAQQQLACQPIEGQTFLRFTVAPYSIKQVKHITSFNELTVPPFVEAPRKSRNVSS